MRKYNLIILAGGEDEGWCARYGYRNKALLPILDKPMLEWVIDAFRTSRYIDNIVVVGPKDLSQLSSMRYVQKHLHESNSFLRNLLKSVFYVKASLYKFANDHNGYLISSCDAVFLTTDIIDKTLKDITEYGPGIALHYVQKETIAESGYPAENRTYINVAGRSYTGSNIYYVKSFGKLLHVLRDIGLLRECRKDPEKFLQNIGCEHMDIPGAERLLSNRVSTKVKVLISPYAEMGVDVDKASDYEFAKVRLAKSGQVNEDKR